MSAVPGPALRAGHFKYEDGEYNDGYVYSPRDGKTYRIEAKIIDQNTVKIRGHLGIPLLGQSQIWKRVRSPGHRL